MIRLEPMTHAHLRAVDAMIRDPDVLRFTRVPDPPPPDFVRHWYARYEQGRLDGTKDGFAIVDGDGEFLGLALVPEIEAEARTAELGYMVAPEARGRGAATEALRQLTDWAFDRGLIRLELRIDADNAPSVRVAERCGYTREGLLRSVHFKDGRRTDLLIYSRLPGDA